MTTIIGGGPFSLVAGEWTDDTSTALLLAESLLTNRGFFPHDQQDRYHQWYTEGHLGSTNVCFDIGIGTRVAVLAHKDTKNPYPTSSNDTRAGNGSLMRLAPIAMAYYNQNPAILLALSAQSSRTTHGAKACLDSCQFYAALIAGALKGQSKSALLATTFYTEQFGGDLDAFCPEVRAVVEGSYKTKNPPDIVGGGYVVQALEAALWSFASTDTFEEGALKIANLGNDADTTTAIYGQLAGAYYGEEAIPETWRTKLAFKPLIEGMADELFRLSEINGFAIVEETTSDATLSPSFVDLHTCMLMLEKDYAEIKKRLEPGPKLFKTLKDLDAAVESFTTRYLATAPDCAPKLHLLQHDFINRIIATQRTLLEKRLGKPKIFLPFSPSK